MSQKTFTSSSDSLEDTAVDACFGWVVGSAGNHVVEEANRQRRGRQGRQGVRVTTAGNISDRVMCPCVDYKKICRSLQLLV